MFGPWPPPFRSLGHQRGSRELVFEVLVDGLGLGDDQPVPIERRGLAERIDLQIVADLRSLPGIWNDLDLRAFFVNRNPALGREVGKIHVVELHPALCLVQD